MGTWYMFMTITRGGANMCALQAHANDINIRRKKGGPTCVHYMTHANELSTWSYVGHLDNTWYCTWAIHNTLCWACVHYKAHGWHNLHEQCMGPTQSTQGYWHNPTTWHMHEIVHIEMTLNGENTVTSTNESMPMSGSINEGQLGNLKATKA